MSPTYQTSVFVNCPYDEDYKPLLEAILFCLVYLGLRPLLAASRFDSGETRIDRIIEMIQASRFSIHDLSRCESGEAGEIARLNMPFELGIDYALQRVVATGGGDKRILILEEEPFRYQKAISDIAGCDIKAHGGEDQSAIRQVRNWLATEPGMGLLPGAASIYGDYLLFQQWLFDRQDERGFSAEDRADYEVVELIDEMLRWHARGHTPDY